MARPRPPFVFSGFFQPVDNPGTAANPVFNKVRAGSAIPVKFSLGANHGLNIFAAGDPKSVPVTCNTAGLVGLIEETVNAGQSSFSYDAGSNLYKYVWKTDKGWGNSCRKLTLKLTDDSEHLAYFTLTK